VRYACSTLTTQIPAGTPLPSARRPA